VIQLLERLTAELSAQQRSTLDAIALPSIRAEAWRYSPLRALEAKVRGWGSDPVSADTPSDLNASLLASALALAPTDLTIASGTAGIDPTINPHFKNARSVFAEAAALTAGGQHVLSAATLWICAPQAAAKLVQVSQRFTVPANARALLVLEQQDGGAKDALCNLLYQIDVAESATLDVLHLQCAGAGQSVIERSEITLAANATLNYFELQCGLGWARHELSIALAGSGSSANVSALSLLSARQHADIQLSLWHETKNTRSSTRVKAIADGRARSVFNGKIFVAPGSDGTDAQLKTNNLLLSDTAEIDAKPELEIYAEEVSCSHGATVGQLDENALFYLQSRGIDPVDARNMLIYAFAAELLSRVDCQAAIPVLNQIIQSRLSSQIGEATYA
jgi:Fe-S cluster assembly protein SufD